MMRPLLSKARPSASSLDPTDPVGKAHGESCDGPAISAIFGVALKTTAVDRKMARRLDLPLRPSLLTYAHGD
jgi:hypothetical protein